MRLSNESIQGRTVIAADGQVIGEISTVFLDSDAWRVESLQVTLRKDVADRIGAHRSVLRAGELEIPVRVIQSVGATVVLSVPVDELRAVLPGETEQEPARH
jgi:sporulation protein YlmC with PRC-barrel domain